MKQKFLEANNDKKRKNDLIILSLPNDYKLLDGMTSGCQQCYVENDYHRIFTRTEIRIIVKN